MKLFFFLNGTYLSVLALPYLFPWSIVNKISVYEICTSLHSVFLYNLHSVLAFLDLVYDSRFLMIYKSLNSVFTSFLRHFLAGL